MISNLGFGTITSQGVGSNLDIASIVSSLMQIERIPLDRLIAQKDSFDAKISSLGTIKSSLSTFETALSTLTSGSGLLANKADSSDTAIVNATGISGAPCGQLCHCKIQASLPSRKSHGHRRHGPRRL